MKSLLVLAVLLLAYVLVGVAPASALVATWDIAVVRGTDNGVYAAAYYSPGLWGSWVSLAGATLSAPGICEAAGFRSVYVVVRGTDNGIYAKEWSSGTWGNWFSPSSGATIDQPACAVLNYLYIVVRGTGGELYWNRWSGVGWSGWVDLHGASASAPVLVSTPPLNRLDLFVQGTDNGIYHKAFTSGAWSSSWDSPGGATSSKPAASFFTRVFSCSPGPCVEEDYLILVVRGTDNSVYWNLLRIGGGWDVWRSLSGATLSAPTLAYWANGCVPGSLTDCASNAALAVRGTDNKVYHQSVGGIGLGWFGWDSPGGSISNSPALAYVPPSLGQFLLLVEGSPSNNLYANTCCYWSAYSSVGGATPSDPALVAVL